MDTRKYYYGDGTDHVIELTESQANVANKIRLTDETWDLDGNVYFRTNLSVEETAIYNIAADILNAYLEDHTVMYLDTDKPVLRPVE